MNFVLALCLLASVHCDKLWVGVVHHWNGLEDLSHSMTQMTQFRHFHGWQVSVEVWTNSYEAYELLKIAYTSSDVADLNVSVLVFENRGLELPWVSRDRIPIVMRDLDPDYILITEHDMRITKINFEELLRVRAMRLPCIPVFARVEVAPTAAFLLDQSENARQCGKNATSVYRCGATYLFEPCKSYFAATVASRQEAFSWMQSRCWLKESNGTPRFKTREAAISGPLGCFERPVCLSMAYLGGRWRVDVNVAIVHLSRRYRSLREAGLKTQFAAWRLNEIWPNSMNLTPTVIDDHCSDH